MRFGALVTAAILVGSLGPAAAVGAEEFEDRVDVLEIQVPVNVVGRDGNAVRGLTSEDFVVREGRREREIADLRVIDLRALESTDGRIQMEHVLPAEGRRHLLLVFDLTFSSPGAILRARQAARRFVLRDLHPTDLAAVMSFSEQAGPQLLVTFTSDRAQLARAIDNLGRQDLLKGRPGDPLRFVVDNPSTGADLQSPDRSASDQDVEHTLTDTTKSALDATEEVMEREIARQERSYARGRIETWVGYLDFLGRALTRVAGRKHVVYFSEGFDDRLLMGRGAQQQMQDQRLSARVGHQLPVDPDALYGNLSLLSEITRALIDFEKSGTSIQAVDIAGVSSRRNSGFLHSTMARETGGVVIENTNELEEELGAILERSEVTYLLTFRADDVERDGSYHPIEVKVPGAPEAEVLFRPGYHAPEPFQDLHPLEKSLLAADALAAAAPRREIALDLLAAPFQATSGRAYVPVIVEIDGDSVLDSHDGDILPLEIYAYASDSRGRMQDFFTQLVSLRSADARESLPGSGLKYYGHLNLDPGEHLLRVMARNGATGDTGVSSIRLVVPDFADERPDLAGPFAPEPLGRWLLVRENRGAEGSQVIYPFTVKNEIFVPAVRPLLSHRESNPLYLMAYGLGPGELAVSGEIFDSEGETVGPADIELAERVETETKGYEKLQLGFHPPDLEPGGYRLHLTVGRADESLSAKAVMSFRIGR